MFDVVRKHTKLMMGVLFVLIIPSFVLFGIEGYTHFNDAATKVATVDGRAITQMEWDSAHRAEIDRLRAANPTLDLALLDTPAMRYATLERLVRDRVLAVAAADAHLGISDARLAAALQSDPTIAAFRQADGSMDMQAYGRLLASQGLTPEGFEARVRADMATQQVLAGVLQSSFASQAQANVAMNAFLEQRQVRVQTFNPADFASKITPTDADLQAYYQQHTAQYQAPESANIEYVVLDLDSVKKGITVSEQDLRTYYDSNAASLGEPEERRASHILIAAPKDAPAAEREQARTAAAKLLEQLRQSPDSFGDVARQSSQDEVSAASGGDLGAFRRDRGIDPVITEATYALAKVGDISDLVESDFGYHIVRLTDLKPANVPPFDKLRAQLEEQLRTRDAQSRFSELAEEFRNGVYEQSDSLQPVADKLKLTLHTAENVTRTPAPGATGPLANDKLLAAVFSTDAIERKRNTEAMETGPNQLASARVVTHSPAHARAFDEVKNEVRTAFLAQRGAEMAQAEGQARLKAWTDKPDSATGLPAAITLSRENPQGQAPQLVEAVLRADPAKLPTFIGVDLGAGGYVVAQIEKVLPRAEPSSEQAAQDLQRYDQVWAVAEASSYYDMLRTRYKARILAPQPAAVSAAAR